MELSFLLNEFQLLQRLRRICRHRSYLIRLWLCSLRSHPEVEQEQPRHLQSIPQRSFSLRIEIYLSRVHSQRHWHHLLAFPNSFIALMASEIDSLMLMDSTSPKQQMIRSTIIYDMVSEGASPLKPDASISWSKLLLRWIYFFERWQRHIHKRAWIDKGELQLNIMKVRCDLKWLVVMTRQDLHVISIGNRGPIFKSPPSTWPN